MPIKPSNKPATQAEKDIMRFVNERMALLVKDTVWRAEALNISKNTLRMMLFGFWIQAAVQVFPKSFPKELFIESCDLIYDFENNPTEKETD